MNILTKQSILDHTSHIIGSIFIISNSSLIYMFNAISGDNNSRTFNRTDIFGISDLVQACCQLIVNIA